MSVLSQDADVVVRWSTAERVAALKRIEPQAANRLRQHRPAFHECLQLRRKDDPRAALLITGTHRFSLEIIRRECNHWCNRSAPIATTTDSLR